MADMLLHKDNVLELDYLKKKLGTNNVSIISEKSFNKYESQKKKYIFDPQETGDYIINYNNKSLAVNVYKGTPPSGISRWRFNGDVTDSWNDNDGNDNTGSSGYVPGSNGGQAKVFDGNDDYLRIPDSDNQISNTSDYTISVLVKPMSFTGWQTIIGQWTINSGNNGWAHFGFEDNSNSVSNYIRIDGLDKRVIEKDMDIKADNWYHLVTTVETEGTNHNMKLYINGRLRDSATYSGDWNTDDNVDIGISSKKPTYANNPFDGLIEDIRIYNRTLLDREVNNLYVTGHI